MTEKISSELILSCPAIHDPPFTYFSSAYMTLLSIIQAFVIAWCLTSAFEVFGKGNTNLACFLWQACLLPMLLFASILWHKYVNHHQIAGWQLTWRDTIIVVLFGLFQCIGLALFKHLTLTNNVINIDALFEFNWSMVAIISLEIFLGTLAYAHSGSKLNHTYVKQILDHRFRIVCNDESNITPPCKANLPDDKRNTGDCPAKDIHLLVLGFEVISLKATLITSRNIFLLSLIYLSVICAIQNLKLDMLWVRVMIILTFNSLAGIFLWVYLVKYDLRRLLAKGGNRLSTYGGSAKTNIDNTSVFWWYRNCFKIIYNEFFNRK